MTPDAIAVVRGGRQGTGSVGDEADVEAEVDAEIQRVLPDGFSVNSAESAAWVVRKIAEARRYAARVKEWAAVEQRRAEREEARLLFLFGGQLRSWAADSLKAQSGKKSMSLPGGVIGFRAVPSRLVVINESIALRWARTHCPSAVISTERLVKTPLFEHFEQTGELPDGAELTAAKDDFYVR